MTDGLNLLRTYNFTNLPDPVSPSSGIYNLSYSLLGSGSELEDATYNGVTYYSHSDPEVQPTNFDQVSSTQLDSIARILAGSPADNYSAYFGDVANVTFSLATGDEADIVIAQNSMGNTTFFPDDSILAVTELYTGDPMVLPEGKHGDIFLNKDASAGWAKSAQGTIQFWTVLHELMHAVAGTEDTVHDSVHIFTGGEAYKDSQQYTIASYHAYDWSGSTAGTNALYDGNVSTPLYAYGLQLYDMQAIQAVYGKNTDVRVDDTVYSMGNGLGRDGDQHKAFIYTIWDGNADDPLLGASIGDTLDASGFTSFGSRIDLHDGAFSSIGENGIGQAAYDPVAGRDVNNVAIAYGVTIENAVGTIHDDDITGNDSANLITGGKGDDVLKGEGGNDTYKFGIGDGNDTIFDTSGANIAKLNVFYSAISLTTDVSQTDLKFVYGDDTITADNQFADNTLSELLIGARPINLSLIPVEDLLEDDSPILLNVFSLYTVYAGHEDVDGSNDPFNVDRLYGDINANQLTGGHGDDILKGGAAADTYKWSIGDGADTIVDTWESGDNIKFGTGITSEMLGVDTSGSDLILYVNVPGEGVDLTLVGAASLAGSFLTNHVTFETQAQAALTDADAPITSGSWSGVSIYDPGTATYAFLGTFAQDRLENYHAGDTVNGDDNNDALYGYQNTLYGDGGNDYLHISSGTASGGTGNDTIIASGSTVHGNDGDDYIDAYNGTVYGDAGGDTIYIRGGALASTVYGGTGNDTIIVQDNNAVIDGGDDDDTIALNGADDAIIHVSSGNDVVSQNDISGIPVLVFSSSLMLGDLSFAMQANGRDLLVTHPDGTILIVDFIDHIDGWSVQFGALGTPVNLVMLGLDYSGDHDEYIDAHAMTGLTSITTGDGNDMIYLSSAGGTVYAGAGQDIVYGNVGTDIIHGGDGIDLLYGHAYLQDDGDNSIYGDGGDDLIVGGAHTDILNGGDGNDTIHGSDFYDPMISQDADTIHGNDGNDTIDNFYSSDVYGDDGDDTINASSDYNMIDGGAGNDPISVTGDNNTIYGGSGDDTIELYGSSLTIDGGADNDSITVIDYSQLDNLSSDDTISGGDGNDSITFTGSNSEINGDAGNDTIYLIDGEDDTVAGGDGDDHITSDVAIDDLSGGNGNDTITVFAASTVHGDGGNDAITGSGTLYGDSGNDTVTLLGSGNLVYGDDGADTLLSSSGNSSTFHGGDGNDIIIATGDGYTIYAEDDDDTITATGSGNFVDPGAGINTVFLNGDFGDTNVVQVTQGEDTITADGDAAAVLYFGTGVDTSDLVGSYGEDGNWLTIDTGSNLVRLANSANWYMSFGSTPTALSLDHSYSELTATSGDHGFVTLTGNIADEIHSDASNDTFYTYAGNDAIYAGAGDNHVYAGDGNDSITTLGGSDQLYGEAGNDTISAGAGADGVFGGTGADTINGGDGADDLYTSDSFSTSDSASDTANGDAGNDTIHADSSGDTINGGDGTDTLYNVGGTANGGNDNDTIYSSGGTVNGDAGADYISLSGAGTANGGTGADTVAGSSGADIINGGDDADSLSGNAGTDTISGDAGNDTIYGGNDNDTLNGGTGVDYVSGDAGNDIINGQGGQDNLFGGTGADTFKFDDTWTGYGDSDIIYDFSLAQGDKIDLSQLLDTYDPLTDPIANFVNFTVVSGVGTYVSIDQSGSGSSFTAVAGLAGVAVTTSLTDLITNGNLIVE